MVSQALVLDTLHSILGQIARNRAQYLRAIFIDLEVYRDRFRNVGTALFRRLAAFIQNAGTELEELICLSHLKEATPLNFLTLTPSLRRLTLTSHQLNHPRLDSFQPEEIVVNLWAKVPQASYLTRLILYGKRI